MGLTVSLSGHLVDLSLVPVRDAQHTVCSSVAQTDKAPVREDVTHLCGVVWFEVWCEVGWCEVV